MEICQHVPALLAPVLSMQPYELFGPIEEKKPIRDVITHSIESAMAALKTLYQKYPAFEKYGSLTDIETSMYALVDYEILPEKEFQRQKEGYGAEMQVRRETKQEQKTQVHTQLRVEVVEDLEDLSSEEAASIPMPMENIFTTDFWQKERKMWHAKTEGSMPINDLLIRRKEGLENFDPKSRVFSDRLFVTGNVGATVISGNKIIPFQSGTFPLATSVLQIFPDNTMKMIVIDPNEAEYMGIILNYERELRDNPEAQNQLKQWFTRTTEIIFEECIRELKKSNEDFLSLLAEKGEVHTEQELLALNERGLLLPMLQEKFGFRIYGKITDRFQQENIPLFWKKGISTNLGIGEAYRMFFGPREFDLLLVDPQAGILKQGAKPVDEKALLENPDYCELTSQAKFYNGELNHYTPQEKECLKKWFLKQGVDTMYALLGNILRSRPNDINAYENSALKKILDHAQAEEATR